MKCKVMRSVLISQQMHKCLLTCLARELKTSNNKTASLDTLNAYLGDCVSSSSTGSSYCVQFVLGPLKVTPYCVQFPRTTYSSPHCVLCPRATYSTAYSVHFSRLPRTAYGFHGPRTRISKSDLQWRSHAVRHEMVSSVVVRVTENVQTVGRISHKLVQVHQ